VESINKPSKVSHSILQQSLTSLGTPDVQFQISCVIQLNYHRHSFRIDQFKYVQPLTT